MTFVSYTWVTTMIVTVGFYWLLPTRYRSLFLAILTLGFLATFDLISAAFLVALTVTTYFLTTGKFLTKYTIIAAIALVAFIIINYKLQVSNDPFDAIQDVAMPLGISYYSFRIIHILSISTLKLFRNITLPIMSVIFSSFRRWWSGRSTASRLSKETAIPLNGAQKASPKGWKEY